MYIKASLAKMLFNNHSVIALNSLADLGGITVAEEVGVQQINAGIVGRRRSSSASTNSDHSNDIPARRFGMELI